MRVFLYSDVIISVFFTGHFLYLIFPFVIFIPTPISCKNKFTVDSCMLLYFEHMRDVRIQHMKSMEPLDKDD